jgi:hypothetical protein
VIEYRGDDAGISLLEDTVGNPRTEFPRSELLHFLQDAQDFAPVRGRFPGARTQAMAAELTLRTLFGNELTCRRTSRQRKDWHIKPDTSTEDRPVDTQAD